MAKANLFAVPSPAQREGVATNPPAHAAQTGNLLLVCSLQPSTRLPKSPQTPKPLYSTPASPRCRASQGQVWPAIQRMLSILFGFGIAVLFQVLVFPVFARRQLTERLAAALEDSVSLIYESAVKAKDNVSSASLGGRIDDASGASRRKAGSKGKAAGRRTAALQREQRKKAAGLDSLLGPTAVVSRGC